MDRDDHERRGDSGWYRYHDSGEVKGVVPNHYIVLDNDLKEDTATDHITMDFWCWADFLKNVQTTDGKSCSCIPYEVTRAYFDDNFYGAVIAVK